MITPDMETVRPFVEAEIERLINALDLLDGDADLEDHADLEADDCDLKPDHDNEAEHDGRANYLGHCSPIETMIGQRILVGDPGEIRGFPQFVLTTNSVVVFSGKYEKDEKYARSPIRTTPRQV